MLSTLAFLNKVLPPESEGYRCWFAAKDGKVMQGFCTTNQGLADKLVSLDASGFNAYFACSSFKTDTKRTGENVQATKALWLDIDAGAGKPYTGYEEACIALDEFVANAGLPSPTVVKSGNGIHVYWCLATSVEPEVWKSMAGKLKALTSAYGLDADNVVTADIARVLRPVGVRNWKNPSDPKPVVILVEAHEVEVTELFDADPFEQAAPAVPSFDLGDMPRGTPDMTQGYGDGYRTDELLRRAGYCLGPLRMVEGEAIAACLEWNTHNTPPLDYDKVVKTVQSLNRRQAAQEASKEPEHANFFEEKSEPLPPLPHGFKYGRGSEIMAMVKDMTAEEPDKAPMVPKLCCRNPFYIASVRKQETMGTAGSRSVLIMSRTMHEPWAGFTIKERELMAPSWMASLAEYGVKCEPGMEKYFRILIHSMICDKEAAGRLDMSYTSFGWKDNRNSFVVGRKQYSTTGVKEVSGTPEFEKAADLLTPNPKGSLDKWRSAANRLFAPGCEAQAFSVLCSFAAPLMDLLFADDEGGAMVSLVSSKSGQGKTAAILAAETVWGRAKCLRLTEASSVAAKFRSLGVRCNLPVVIDEWGDTDIKVIRDIVAMFTGGDDKARLTLSGEDTRQKLHFKTVWIGTTNLPLVDQLRQEGYAPQAARIFEVQVSIPEHLSRTQTADVNDMLQENAGYAGPVFLLHLLQNYNLDELQVKAKALAQKYGEMLEATTEERFKTRLVAAVTIVSLILTKPMPDGETFLTFTPSIVINKMLEQVKEGMRVKKTTKSHTDVLMEFVRANVQNFLVVEGPYNPKKPYLDMDISLPRGELMGRYERLTKRLYLPHDVVQKLALKNKIPYLDFAKELVAQGVVSNRNRQTNLTAGVTKLAPTRASCWDIDLTHDDAAEAVYAVDNVEVNNKLRKTK